MCGSYDMQRLISELACVSYVANPTPDVPERKVFRCTYWGTHESGNGGAMTGIELSRQELERAFFSSLCDEAADHSGEFDPELGQLVGRTFNDGEMYYGVVRCKRVGARGVAWYTVRNPMSRAQ